MKAFFWKPFVIDPAKPEHKEILWAKCKEYPINEKFMEDVVECFHDKRAAAGKTAGAADAGAGIIKVTGPIKKQFFSPEESKNLQMGLPKFPKADVIKEAVTTYADGLVTTD